MIKSKSEIDSDITSLNLRYFLRDLSESLALTKETKMSFFLHIAIRFGHISVSNKIKALGFHILRNLFKKIGKSIGRYWCFILEPNLSINIFDPVGVVVVTNTSESSYFFKMPLIKGIEALTSPTETA